MVWGCPFSAGISLPSTSNPGTPLVGGIRVAISSPSPTQKVPPRSRKSTVPSFFTSPTELSFLNLSWISPSRPLSGCCPLAISTALTGASSFCALATASSKASLSTPLHPSGRVARYWSSEMVFPKQSLGKKSMVRVCPLSDVDQSGTTRMPLAVASSMPTAVAMTVAAFGSHSRFASW